MDLLAEAKSLFTYTQSFRRDFHRHPEIGFEEIRTAGIVAEELNILGLDVKTGVGKTGVVGLLKGTRNKPVLLLRFDMDALPIIEETGAEYASQSYGRMHACGHDSHTAVGLTLAKILSAHREVLPGVVKFVFQPAEEGQGGAAAMITDGVLRDPVPDYVMAMHVWNDKPIGWFGISDGPVMAGGDIFDFKVVGKGGHGAVPHLAVDPVLATAQIITALQGIVSRNIPPLESAVVSVTHVEGGSAFNIIPPYVNAEGTIRTFTPQVHEKVVKRFKETVEGVAAAMGCEVEISIKEITFPVINDKKLSALIGNLARTMLTEPVIETTFRTMGSEDMCFLMQDIPGCFLFIGSANQAKGFTYGHHHPKFDIDETCLPS
ncbi:MAG: M20 family metallopeptidase, partial [Chloroflexota bacterium]